LFVNGILKQYVKSPVQTKSQIQPFLIKPNEFIT